MGLNCRYHFVPFRQLASRLVVGPCNTGLEVGGVRPPAGLEDELGHSGQFPEGQVEAVHDFE